MAYVRTSAMIEADLARVATAIERIESIGQAHANNSGGSSRTTTEADLEKLYARQTSLLRQLRTANGGGVSRNGSGW